MGLWSPSDLLKSAQGTSLCCISGSITSLIFSESLAPAFLRLDFCLDRESQARGGEAWREPGGKT